MSRPRPGKLHAGKVYDAEAGRQECRARGIGLRIACTGIASNEKPERHRWVVERAHAWFNRFRRRPIRYARRSDTCEAFTSLAASLVTRNQNGVESAGTCPLYRRALSEAAIPLSADTRRPEHGIAPVTELRHDLTSGHSIVRPSRP